MRPSRRRFKPRATRGASGTRPRRARTDPHLSVLRPRGPLTGCREYPVNHPAGSSRPWTQPVGAGSVVADHVHEPRSARRKNAGETLSRNALKVRPDGPLTRLNGNPSSLVRSTRRDSVPAFFRVRGKALGDRSPPLLNAREGVPVHPLAPAPSRRAAVRSRRRQPRSPPRAASLSTRRQGASSAARPSTRWKPRGSLSPRRARPSR